MVGHDCGAIYDRCWPSGIGKLRCSRRRGMERVPTTILRQLDRRNGIRSTVNPTGLGRRKILTTVQSFIRHGDERVHRRFH